MMEGVGPGVKIEEMRSVKKVAMVDAGRTRFGVGQRGLRYSETAWHRISSPNRTLFNFLVRSFAFCLGGSE